MGQAHGDLQVDCTMHGMAFTSDKPWLAGHLKDFINTYCFEGVQNDSAGGQGPVEEVCVRHINLCVLKMNSTAMAHHLCIKVVRQRVSNPADGTEGLLKFSSKKYTMQITDVQDYFKGMKCITGGSGHLGLALEDTASEAAAGSAAACVDAGAASTSAADFSTFQSAGAAATPAATSAADPSAFHSAEEDC